MLCGRLTYGTDKNSVNIGIKLEWWSRPLMINGNFWVVIICLNALTSRYLTTHINLTYSMFDPPKDV